MPHHPLKNSETKRYYQDEARFNDAYSRNNLPKVKVETYIINFDE